MPTFADLFKKYRLRSEFSTLSDFGDALSEEGLIFEDSIFSHWQLGNRTPHKRDHLIAIINLFSKRGGVTTIEQANELMASIGERDLDNKEMKHLSQQLVTRSPFTVPPDLENFIGRKETLKKICWKLINGESVFIEGIAGTGKTSLAIKIAHILKDNFSDGILWHRYDIKGVDGTLIDIGKTFGEDVTKVKSISLKARMIHSLLSKKQILIILDNVEELDNLPLFFLGRKPNYPFLTTSRKKILIPQKDIHSIYLTGFSNNETALLAQNILGKPYVLTNISKLKKLAKLVDYSPLALNIIFKQIQMDPRKLSMYLHKINAKVLKLKYKIYDKQSIEGSLNLSFLELTNDVKTFFISCGLFQGADFSNKALIYVNDITEKDTIRKLKILRNLSLISKSTKDRYRLHPLIKIFLQQKIKDGNLYLKLGSYYNNFLARIGREEITRYPDIEIELDNIIGAFCKCYYLGEYQLIIEMWEYLGVFLWDTGRWMTVNKYGKLLRKACKKIRNNEKLALYLLRELSWLEFWQGSIKKAEDYVLEGLDIATKTKDKYLLALGHLRLGKVNQVKKIYKPALISFRKAHIYFKKTNNLEKQGDILTYIGETFWLMKNYRRAKYYFFRALDLTNKINDIPQRGIIYTHLGGIAFQEGYIDQANSYFLNSLRLAKIANRRAGSEVWNNICLGLVEEMRNDYVAAKELFKIAKKEMIHLGMGRNAVIVSPTVQAMKKDIIKSNLYKLPSHS